MKRINIRSNRKLIIIVNLFLIFSLTVVSVYSWFSAHVDNSVNAYDITVQSPNNLEISFDGEAWGNSLNLASLKTSDGKSNLLDTVKFAEVTGDGESFWIPQLSQQNNYAEVNTDGNWSQATVNEDYLKFTVHMRSKDKLNVYLSSSSFVTPVASVLTGANCDNPSEYSEGDNAFSKDLIAGAVRVSFLNSADSRYIWIPNPQYHLNNRIGSTEYSMTVNAEATTYADGIGTLGNDFVWNNPFKHYYYNSEKVVSEYENTLTSLDVSNSTHLASLTDAAGDYYTASVTFCIWIEGCDTEARRALMDGRFNLSLIFDSYGIDSNN